MQNKKIVIFGGGTFNHIANHLSFAAPAFGTTAKEIASYYSDNKLDVELVLTKMADSNSSIISNEDLENKVDEVISDSLTKIVFFSSAICDVAPDRVCTPDHNIYSFGKNQTRLQSEYRLNIETNPAKKLINKFRYLSTGRKDIFLVGFKTTCDLTPEQQYNEGLELLKKNSCNLVLANDVKTRLNMVICPEEAVYHETTNREEALKGLLEMSLLRSHLTFTRSTVVSGTPVPWNSEEIYPVLRNVVDYCIEKGAYKKFLGVTAGHFAVKLSENEFLTSIRKTDFNDMKSVGLVKVKTDGPDSVIAYGAKPSVGGQSQRIVFTNHQEYDCIVHFHCPIKEGSLVPTASQREVECGSHSCGLNTSNNLKKFGNLSAVYLDQHGPNIVFHHSIDPQEVIDFIEENFDLTKKTGGYNTLY
jgi:hypothetical protein